VTNFLNHDITMTRLLVHGFTISLARSAALN
jgi:hypothetical protein